MSNKGQFKKGNIPWNKNVKGIHLSPKSEFKKGQLVGSKNHSWRGGVQFNTRDCVHLNIGSNKRVRRPRYVYEQAYGKIPKGFVIIHKDGDKNNDKLSNLQAVSRAELLKMNNPRIKDK